MTIWSNEASIRRASYTEYPQYMFSNEREEGRKEGEGKGKKERKKKRMKEGSERNK